MTVNAVNDAPTISNIPDQTTALNTPTAAIPFTVGDVETPAGSLQVSGSSANQALAPDGNIVFGGSGANRTVTITPATGQFGSVTIIISVSDGIATSSDTFVLTVNPPPPAFTVAKINFQPASSPVPAGYLADGGLVYGNRGNGLTYGWSVDNMGNMFDRNSSRAADQRYDTLCRFTGNRQKRYIMGRKDRRKFFKTEY